MSTPNLNSLHQLAHLYNVQTAYYDVSHKRRQISPDSLLAVLKALRAPISSMDGITSALRERRQTLWQRILEPVIVVRGREYPLIKVRLPMSLTDYCLNGDLELESGERHVFKWAVDDLDILERADIEGSSFIVARITLPRSLPYGYHKFLLEIKGTYAKALLISAPEKAYTPSEDTKHYSWGIFTPLYALHSQNNWGSGDYSLLGSFTDWVSSSGGQIVATLPLLPTFTDEPFNSSPYSPVSRLLWNEFYINVDNVPEISESPQAKVLLQSSSLLSATRELRSLPLVDYRRLMALKRGVIEECCRYLVEERPRRFLDFKDFIQDHPIVEDYASFRATMEKQHSPWPSWEQRRRDGTLNESDYEEKNKLYYMYAQWLAHQQIQDLANKVRRRGISLYFDLPVGNHSEGYDVWRERDVFGLDASVGSPPDVVFTKGQDWGFPPLLPDKIRGQSYRYIINYLRHHLQYAGMLRIDHVMGLHRLFWIPKGLDATHGAYVRYRADELYAILCLESHRHRSIIVGEDLGTVPAYVRPDMSQRGLHRMYVLHYELADNVSGALHQPQPNMVASLNTHDMPPFASFWQGLDILERYNLGLLNIKGTRDEKRSRKAIKHALLTFLRSKGWLKDGETDERAVLKACLSFLCSSGARIVLINLEDLWLETQSQNVPSTGDRNPNWQRKARYTLEEFLQLPEVRDMLKEIDRLRKEKRK